MYVKFLIKQKKCIALLSAISLSEKVIMLSKSFFKRCCFNSVKLSMDIRIW